MKMYQVKVRFIADYLQARISDKTKKEFTNPKGKKSQEGGEQNDKLQLEEFSYRDKKGYYIPACHFKGALINGGRQVKRKPRGSFSSLVRPLVWVEPDKIYLDIKEPVDRLISYPKRSDGSRVRTVHPVILKTGSEIEFNVRNLADDDISKSALESILEWAGKMYGIGGRHPDYGRFEVISLTEL